MCMYYVWQCDLNLQAQWIDKNRNLYYNKTKFENKMLTSMILVNPLPTALKYDCVRKPLEPAIDSLGICEGRKGWFLQSRTKGDHWSLTKKWLTGLPPLQLQ